KGLTYKGGIEMSGFVFPISSSFILLGLFVIMTLKLKNSLKILGLVGVIISTILIILLFMMM
uniref:hypothetical protein n=1 Tax=Alicyclobacillus mali (ex Roth et al. 2021) TaxID=1123961 RepID=UPI001E63D11C